MSLQLRRDVFQAIADPTRRAIIDLVAEQPMNLNTIAGNFDVSRSAVSQQIRILAECGIVVIKKQGRERYCEVSLEQLREIADWMEPYRQLWEGRMDAIDRLLKEMPVKKKGKK